MRFVEQRRRPRNRFDRSVIRQPGHYHYTDSSIKYATNLFSSDLQDHSLVGTKIGFVVAAVTQKRTIMLGDWLKSGQTQS